MIYAETGDVDNATNHLIEVLWLDPSDSWNWVVLGNLYAGGKNDPETGEKFIRKALELNPNDPWALNSLATFTQKAGRSEEALALFDQAIAAHPDLPNPYLGKALVLDTIQQTNMAAETLEIAGNPFSSPRLPSRRRPGVGRVRGCRPEGRKITEQGPLGKCLVPDEIGALDRTEMEKIFELFLSDRAMLVTIRCVIPFHLCVGLTIGVLRRFESIGALTPEHLRVEDASWAKRPARSFSGASLYCVEPYSCAGIFGTGPTHVRDRPRHPRSTILAPRTPESLRLDSLSKVAPTPHRPKFPSCPHAHPSRQAYDIPALLHA